MRRFLIVQYGAGMRSVRAGWGLFKVHWASQVRFWLIALTIGIASGFAALLFRKAITALQVFAYGAHDMADVHSAAGLLPWYWVLVVPILGGLAVGLILHRFT
ncbi:MAG: chloride channel protein, partial [Roseovarius sp.]|nr:chloride channel protein [Roseovarius sp.]